ncbi:phage head closure protein [Marinobacterium lutimaris]|uniref:Phage head-tail adaptor, putative, SPP1 family n=1 Tax=Marinobacterium lutimaris TaxID=568106 RepID=A0A1H5YA29_9GAMM|nr:phage head closure protein [Marinobacterium lutimaris]SEG20440.1 phage head-tail adaptor, putative, SPP1 family [Marinobacterium lutimaris]
MRAGPLNTRVTFQQLAGGESDNGYPDTDSWEDVVVNGSPLTVWAEVRQTTGRERWANDHVAVTSPINVRIRYKIGPFIHSAMRIKHGDRYFQLKATPIDPDGKRESLICLCEEITPDGQ